MSEKELERRLRQAAEHAAPDDLEGILSRCREQKGNVIPMAKTRTGRRALHGLLAACLALCMVGGGAGVWYQRTYAVASVVSLDVNPSIELRINREEKVLSCTPLNEDARIVLGEMDEGEDLKGAKLDVAVNAVVGALVRHGYLEGLSSAILVSVEDKDQARAARLEAELKATIGGVLETQAPNTTILSQSFTEATYDAYCDHGDKERAHPILSSGKTALVGRVMEMNETIKLNSSTAFDQLSALSVEELNDLLVTGEKRIPIGSREAAWAAEEYAGTLELSSVTTEVDPELDEQPAHYEVELHTPWGEFEYKVDAFTGEILSGPANVLALVSADRPADAGDGGGSNGKEPAETTAPDPQISFMPLIGEEAAWAAAYKHAGCSAGDAAFRDCELDEEDGRFYCYELEFCVGDTQYDYEIDCYTGAVLKYEWEACDETDHGHHSEPSGHHSSGHH